MLDSSPRPLLQHRLERLVHGLRERMDGSLQKTAVEVAQLNETVRKFEQEYSVDESKLLQEQSAQMDSSTTDWDEAVHACWDSAERMAYGAVHETAAKISQLRKEAKRLNEQTTAEAKQRIADIEKRFLQAKNVPVKKLNAFRANSKSILEELIHVESTADAALALHSLRVPKMDASKIEFDQPATAADATEQLTKALANARLHCDRLTNNALAKFFDSVWWWGFCALDFVGVVAALSLLRVMPVLGAVLSGIGAAVVVVLLGFIGIRPWLKRSAAAEYPLVKQYAELARSLNLVGDRLAVEENDAELKRLAAKRDARYQQAKAWRDEQFAEILKKLSSSTDALQKQANEQKLRAKTELTTGLDDTNNLFENRLIAEEETGRLTLRRLRSELETRKSDVQNRVERLNQGGALRMQIATQKALQVITRSRRWCNENFPDWQTLKDDFSNWPDTLAEPILPLGSLPVGTVLPDDAKKDLGVAQLHAPVLFSPLHDGYLTIIGDPSHSTILQLVRSLVMRALTSLPPGKTQVCVIDPPGLGRDFGWLMHLGDFDPQLVNHRVWTQPGHIAKQLNQLALAAEDFIQQSLRNQYQNIVQYNQDAGALSEPYRLLVWSSLPSGLDDQSWKSLQSVLDSGARCGIIPILIIDPKISWPIAGQQELVGRRGLHLTLSEDGQSFVANSDTLRSIPIDPLASVPESQSQQLIKEVGRRALLSNRVEVPLENMVPTREQRWQGDSSISLDIPIGQSGVGRTHSLRLGVGTAQHAIIAGKTGSGKSSLLHALITSALLKYSPERLRVVLLDFKKGVEFQVYSDAKIPHADIIGVESHREFGLSALEYVDSCMQRRGESFRSVGVQDLASWNALNPDRPMPRMLIVIDEFQELFVEDDKLSGQASLILDRIVRQGRSFGVHAVLSSQTLAGSYSLPRTTLGQMAVRIALQCDASDAQIIFAEDNPAAARLKYPGQAVYNDAGGRIEGNQPMQIGWLAKQKQQEWFGEFQPGYHNNDPSTNRLGRTVVYDGNRAATWDENNANLAIEFAQAEINADATWCITGESVAISPAVVFPITKQAGRNVLLVGADDAQAAAVLDAVNSSFVRSARKSSQAAQVFVVQGGKPTDAHVLSMPAQWEKLDCDLKVTDIRGTDAMLKHVYELLKQRVDDEEDKVEASPVLLNLLQIGRLRTLRREDDFGMGGFGETELTPDKHLEEILRDGPSHAVHVVIWAEGYSTVGRWLSRTSLREMEVRLLMQMSSSDSTNLVDSVAASRLGDHVMLLFDEATGQEQRFRPFAPKTLDNVKDWVND